MRVKKISIIYLLTALILLTGCVGKEVETLSYIEAEGLKEQVKSLEEQIKYLEEENDSLETRYWNLYRDQDLLIEFSKEAVNQLNSDKRDKLAKEQFTYEIKINGVHVAEKETQISEQEFNIILSEEQTVSSTLIHGLNGDISGNYRDHMKIVGIEPQNITFPDGTVVTAVVYEFKDIPDGTEFQIELTDDLRDRIGLSSNTIRVTTRIKN